MREGLNSERITVTYIKASWSRSKRNFSAPAIRYEIKIKHKNQHSKWVLMFEKVRLETFHINLLMGATIFDKHYIIQWKTDIMLLFNILSVQWFFLCLSFCM